MIWSLELKQIYDRVIDADVVITDIACWHDIYLFTWLGGERNIITHSVCPSSRRGEYENSIVKNTRAQTRLEWL